DRRREAMRLASMLKAWNDLTKPVIAQVHGCAFGGGLGLIAVSDIAVAAVDTKFAFSETRLGLIPATISPYVAMRMGEAKMRRVILSARVFGAAEAMELDLVSKVVAEEEIDDAVEEEAAPFLRCAPGAVAKAKSLARSLGREIDERVIEESVSRLSECWESDEAHEGITAFFEKRSPNWLIS
ncbi:MAG: enoyl-CoA hydratase-related protein, partial [Albidovulum sp.]|nr:enoyl-CoA hydratase-related protein [Albidovulum sp.]